MLSLDSFFMGDKMNTSLTKELKKLFGNRIPSDQVDTVKKYIEQRKKRKGFEYHQAKSDFHTLKDVMSEVFKVVIKKEQ